MLLRYINLLVHILVACKYVALFNALETCTSKGIRDNNIVEYINLFHCRVLSNFLHNIHTCNSKKRECAGLDSRHSLHTRSHN